MTLNEKDARALRLKIADRQGDIANAQADIDAMMIELGQAPAPPPVTAPAPPTAGIPAIRGLLVKDDWNQPWAAAYWSKDALPWLFENAILSNGEIRMNLTPNGGASVQANGSELSTAASFAVDVTVDQPTPGIIQSPLYLFGADYTKTQDEVDFEVVGTKGLLLAVHRTGTYNVYGKTIPGDWSGRHRWEIDYIADELIVWRVDGKELARVTKAELGDKFPTAPLKPYIEIWPTNNDGWAGKFDPPVTLALTVHGYRRC